MEIHYIAVKSILAARRFHAVKRRGVKTRFHFSLSLFALCFCQERVLVLSLFLPMRRRYRRTFILRSTHVENSNFNVLSESPKRLFAVFSFLNQKQATKYYKNACRGIPRYGLAGFVETKPQTECIFVWVCTLFNGVFSDFYSKLTPSFLHPMQHTKNFLTRRTSSLAAE